MPSPPLSFENTENAFAYKDTSALRRAYLLFQAMRHPLLVAWGTRLTTWAMKVGLPIDRLLRVTLFPQFVGGETLEETAPVADMLGRHGVQVILDYGVEGGAGTEEAREQACTEFLRVVDYAATQPNIPFISIKVTGIARFSLLEKLDRSVATHAGPLMKRYEQAMTSLTPVEQAEWQLVQDRLGRICARAAEKGVGVLVDAEETWIQDPVDVITLQMMDRYNKGRAVVFNTAQLYRHDRLAFVQDALEAAAQRGFLLGVKLVRGAYMEKERDRARQLGYPSPIQPDKPATDRDFNEALQGCLSQLEHASVIIASHNEQSNLLAVGQLAEQGLAMDHPHVHFSQLYGMSDHITFNLAKAGCRVSKYLPFGPLHDVVPYLLRRAQENTSVAGQTGRELLLLQKERARRRALR